MKPIKYSVQELLGVGFTLVVLGIGMAYGIDVVADIRDDFSVPADCNQGALGNCSAEFNATAHTITGLSKITEKIETIAVVVVASVIIGILVTYLWARFARM